MNGLDAPVAEAFERAVSRLSAAGAGIEEFDFPEIDEIAAINQAGGLSVIESYAYHRHRLERHSKGYDPRVLARMMRGAPIPSADYYDLL